MRTLEEFQAALGVTLQRLGSSPSVKDVDAAGRELVNDGVPPGASFEGLLLLRELAELREKQEKRSDDPQS